MRVGEIIDDNSFKIRGVGIVVMSYFMVIDLAVVFVVGFVCCLVVLVVVLVILLYLRLV